MCRGKISITFPDFHNNELKCLINVSTMPNLLSLEKCVKSCPPAPPPWPSIQTPKSDTKRACTGFIILRKKFFQSTVI